MRSVLRFLALLAGVLPAAHADPLLTSWFTTYSTKYARIYTNDANKTAGTAVTIWTNGTQTQATPAYSGVQQIDFDASWVYIKTTGLAGYTMGPWSNGAFPNLPKNQGATYRLPRVTNFVAAPASKTLTGGGVIGYFVDGVGMFDSRDAFYWNGTADTQGTGYWNRDAYVNEGATFDPGYAHHQNTGVYHYHANPIALRYLLGDHVSYNASTRTYAESTAPVTKHSPILGWAADGYPIYGPYGYSGAMNSASPLTRMRTGYALRNGANGTDNLTATGRTAIPQWAVNLGYSYATSTTGPAVSAGAVLGKYIEDYAYLGDLGRIQGTDFDLDQYNGRSCVTPEFPGGVYAYFVAIDASGTPVFPYNIGRAFRGSPTGGNTTLPGTATNYLKTGPNAPESMSPPSVNAGTGDVTVTWTSIEGSTYKLETTGDLAASPWPVSTTFLAERDAVTMTAMDPGAALSNAKRFYRVTNTAIDPYDGGGATTTASPPTVDTGAAAGVSGANATLNGVVNANGNSTLVTFEYGTTSNYGSTTSAAQSPVTGAGVTSVTAALSLLSPNTTYHYRTKAVSSGGTRYGRNATFTTTAGGGGTSTAPGGSANRGTSVTVTITITAPPALPPLTNAQGQTIMPTSVAITDANVGVITGTSVSRPAQGTVIATFAIPSGAAAGAHTIDVTFPPAGTGPAYHVSFTFN